jgi:hypothetical protein
MRPYLPGQDFYNLIETAVPEVIRAEYPMFVDFLKLFLTYLEQERVTANTTVMSEYGALANNQIVTTVSLGGVSYEMRKFLEYRDVSTTLDEFVPHFLQMFAKNWPQHTYVTPDQFVTTLRYFYTHKSLEETAQWFFRALFNEHADLYYPRTDILKASDGTWYTETSFKVGAPANGYPNTDVAQYYMGQVIRSATGQAQVERVRTTVVGQSFGSYLYVNELLLNKDSIVGSFEAGQDVWNLNSIPEIHTTILPGITGVDILEGGAAYQVGDIVTFSQGPGQGEGFGAAAVVSAVGKAPLNGVTINDGGDGYVVGDPVVFTSSSGTGADAVIDQVITGNFLLEDGSGYILGEAKLTGDIQYLDLEDRSFIAQDLTIEKFVDGTIEIGAADYSAADQPDWTANTILEYVFASTGRVAFMIPWCFRDFSGNTANVTLANTMLVVDMTSNATFANNDANVYVIAAPTDATTTRATASITGRVLLSEIASGGNNRNRLYVTNTTMGFATLQTVKYEGSNKVGTGVVKITSGLANVVGTGTSFLAEVSPNAHLSVSGGTYVVKSVVNSTFLTLYTTPGSSVTAAFTIVPTGTVRSVTNQSQQNFGKIRHIQFLSPGSGYAAPPITTANDVFALAQEVYYYDAGSNTFVASNGTIHVFKSANLVAQQSAGQITHIDMTDSGVYYTDANSIAVTAIHSLMVPEARDAQLTANIGLGSITSKFGAYRNTQGFLSADKYLQDGDYYNDHTYVVRVAESFDRWEAIYKKILHPAGFKVLGEFVLAVDADVDTQLDAFVADDAVLDLEIFPEGADIQIGGSADMEDTKPPSISGAKFMMLAGNGAPLFSSDSGSTWSVPTFTDLSPTKTALPATLRGGNGGGAGALNWGTGSIPFAANTMYFPVDDGVGNLGIRLLANVGGVLTSEFIFDFALLGIYISGNPAPVVAIDSLVTDGTTIFAKCETSSKIFIVKIPIADPSTATLWAAGSVSLGSITNGAVDADYTNFGYLGPITGPLVLWAPDKLVMTRCDHSTFSGIIYKTIGDTGAWKVESPWTNYPATLTVSGGDPNTLWLTVKEGSSSTANIALWSRDYANTWTKVVTYQNIDEDVTSGPMIIWTTGESILMATVDSADPGNRHWMYSSNSGATFTEVGTAYSTWGDLWYNYNAFAVSPEDGAGVFTIAEAVGVDYEGHTTTKVKLSQFDMNTKTMTEITLTPDVILYPSYGSWAGFYRPILGMINPVPLS